MRKFEINLRQKNELGVIFGKIIGKFQEIFEIILGRFYAIVN